jgi:uncharacterized protein (TIGR00369 family)
MNKAYCETGVGLMPNPSLRERLQPEAFAQDVGVEIMDAGSGWCETTLVLLPRHLSADGTVYAGVLSLVLEYTAGLAASTVVDDDECVRIVEAKANLLRPARGNKLRCRSQVVRQGSMILGVGSEVFAHSLRQKSLVARALITLSITDKPKP